MKNSIARRVPAQARLAAGVGGACAAAVLAAACGSGSNSAAGGGASPAGPSSSGSGPVVITTASASGSTFLADGSGHAVYMWSKDSGGKSACSGTCAGGWPPVTATGKVTASGGAKSGDLGTITRPDGTRQVTYDGHPLYFYAGDSGPDTASGQGSAAFGAKWWLVSPSGSDVTASVTSFTMGGSGSAPSPAHSKSGAGGGWS